MLLKSKRLYKQKNYYTRKPVKSFHSKTSKHILKARKMYGVEKIGATNELSKKTGCSISALKKIINKGAGAYYSSGSRPNQTAQSWGIARLASALTSGKAAEPMPPMGGQPPADGKPPVGGPPAGGPPPKDGPPPKP